MLMWALSPNPIHCLRCNLEVDPSTLALPVAMVDRIAHWTALAGAIKTLELDSGPYEQWAQTELLNLDSPVNMEGLSLRHDLDAVRRCYYVLFQQIGADGAFVVPATCPSCDRSFQAYTSDRFTRSLCESCSLALVNP